MNVGTEERDRLARHDPNFRRLLDKHEEYDRRLSELRSRRFLSAAEQLEEVKLKKLKLAIKDQLEAMVRRSTH